MESIRFLLCPACASIQACKEVGNHGSGGSLRGRGPGVPGLFQSGGTVAAEDGLSYGFSFPDGIVNPSQIEVLISIMYRVCE